MRIRRNRARRVPPGYADHPEDERILLPSQTHERLVLWRFIIIYIILYYNNYFFIIFGVLTPA